MATVLKKGYATKEGGELIKKWQRRWFVFKDDGTLSYYSNETETNQRGSINLNTAEVVRKIDERRRTLLEISLISRIFRLAFEDSKTRDEWYEMIDEYVSDIKSGSSGKRPKLEDFEMSKLIGRGTYGRVMLVTKKDTGAVYAMKILDKRLVVDSNEVEHTMAERKVLGSINNPFIMKMHYGFQNETNLYFVMDFVNGGELFFHLGKERRFSIARSKFYSAEILLALEHLHSKGIIYRDLKPENVLLTSEGHICLTDFGLCKTDMNGEKNKTSTFCGTAAYLAPEILLGEKYDMSVDWWSFGILTYEMMVGIPPFYDDDERQMYQNIVNESVRYPPNTPSSIKVFIDGLLMKDPTKRLRDSSIMKTMPFYQGIDFDKLSRKEVVPPFIPNVHSVDDVVNIDPVFLGETEEALNELNQTKNNGDDKATHFEDFTFVSGK